MPRRCKNMDSIAYSIAYIYVAFFIKTNITRLKIVLRSEGELAVHIYSFKYTQFIMYRRKSEYLSIPEN